MNSVGPEDSDRLLQFEYEMSLPGLRVCVLSPQLLVVVWSLTGEVGVDLEISRRALFPVLCYFLVHGDMSKHRHAPASVSSLP